MPLSLPNPFVHRFLSLVFFLFLIGTTVFAQESNFPRLVRYAGSLPAASTTSAPYVINLTFSLFSDQQGGTALWSERQNVQVDADGKYEVRLGASSNDGLPPQLFSANQARWLSVTTEEGVELPRVLLTAVPYAAKASDAETLGGHPATAFVLQDQSASKSLASASTSGSSSISSNITINPGTPNYLAKFLDASTIASSSVSENSTGLGLDVPSPTQRFDVYGRIKLRARGSATSGLWLTDQTGNQQLFLGQIGLDAASPIGFWHGGAWRFAMTNAGNVGIGVGIAPTARLDLGGRAVIRASSEGSSGIWFTSANGTRVLFFGQKGISSTDALGVWHNNAWRFTVDMNGNVGIGVDPQFRLDVAGRVRLRASGTQPSGTWYSGESDAPQLFIGQTDTVAAAPFGIMHGGSWRFIVQSDGKIGIGTTAPTAPLEVAGNLKLSSGGKLVFPDGTALSTAGAATQQTITSNDPALVVTTSGLTTQLALANGGISSTKLADGSVTTDKLADGSITSAKLGTALSPTVIAGVAATIGSNTFTGSQLVQGSLTTTISDPVNDTLIARNTSGTGVAVALRAESSSTVGTAVSAIALSSTGTAMGVNARTGATEGQAVYGEASSSTGLNIGVHGVSRSSQGVGVQGDATSTQGTNYGVVGIASAGNSSAGVYAQNNAISTASTNYALMARNQGNNGVGVFGYATSLSGATYGVYGRVDSANGVAGMFVSSVQTGNVLVAGNLSRKVFRVDTTGTVFALGSFNPNGADYAESVSVRGAKQEYRPGDVLVVNSDADRSFALSAEPYSTAVAGVFSSKPGIVGSRHPLESSTDEIPLAMVGIVPCRVSAENGPIRRGDLLVTSSTPGHAMRGTDRSRMPGAIVGKALQNLEKGTGVIEILVSLQ
jgi:hypothetical protein